MTTYKKKLLSATIASIAGFALTGPSPAIAESWDGFYIGAGIGAQALLSGAESDFEIDDLDTAGFSSDDYATSSLIGQLGAAGFLGTIEGGFDWQINESTVAGVSVDFTLGDLNADYQGSACDEIDSENCYQAGHGLELDNSVSITGRVGHLYDNTLFYGLIGYTASYFKQNGSFGACEDTNSCLTDGSDIYTKNWGDSGWEDGLTVGAGIEKPIGKNLTAKLEYRYTDYNAFGNSFSADPCSDEDVGACSGSSQFDPSLHAIRAMLIYRPGMNQVSTSGMNSAADSNDYDWSGFYIGAGLGARSLRSNAESDFSVDDLDTAGFSSNDYLISSFAGDLGADGVLGTIEGGFNWQIGQSTVVGIGVDIALGDVNAQHESSHCTDIDSENCYQNGHELELENSVSITGRVGHLYDDTLFYGLIGYTASNFKQTGSFGACEDTTSCLTDGSDIYTKNWGDSGWEDGLTVGAGIEKPIGKNLTAKLEYRYTDYNAFGNSFSADPCSDEDVGACSGSSQFDTSTHSVMAKISYRFGF